MIDSKPKSSVIVSIGIFLLGILVTDAWLFYSLTQNPESYFWLKLIFTPVLLVIAIAIARKGYSSTLRLQIGNNQLSYRYLLGSKKSHKISDVKSWHEEMIKQKSTEYRHLTIVLSSGKVLQLSNKENSDYQMIVNYLRKKVKAPKK